MDLKTTGLIFAGCAAVALWAGIMDRRPYDIHRPRRLPYVPILLAAGAAALLTLRHVLTLLTGR